MKEPLLPAMAEPAEDACLSTGHRLGRAAAFIAGSMWVVFAATILVVEHYQTFKIVDYVIYVSAFGIAPITGAAIFHLVDRLVWSPTQQVKFETFTLLLMAASTWIRTPAGLLLLLLLFVAGAAYFAYIGRRTDKELIATPPRVSWIYARNISGAILAAGFTKLALTHISSYLYWPFNDVPLIAKGIDVTEWPPNLHRVAQAAIIALTLLLLGRLGWSAISSNAFAFRRRILSFAPKLAAHRGLLWVIVGVLLGYSIVDPTLTSEVTHHNPYLGPLHLLRNGGWPLLDVFCQYGMSFLAYLPLGAILPLSYQASSLITNFFNIAMMLAAFAIVYRIAGNCRFALPIAALFFVVTWVAIPYNIHLTPSVFGIRWLPAWVLVLILVYRPISPRWGVGTLVALNICALWSVETYFVGVVTLGLYVALVTRVTGGKLSLAIVRAIMVIPFSLVGHGLLVIVTIIGQGQAPGYWYYANVFFQYLSKEGVVHDDHLNAHDSIYTNFWLVFVVVYGAVIFFATLAFTTGKTFAIEPRRLIGFSVIAMANLAEGIYFLGRPVQPLLALAALPLYTVVACLFIFLVDYLVRMPQTVMREAGLLGAFICIASVIGYAADRVQKPFNEGILGSTNASLMMRCLRFGACHPAREIANMASALRDRSPTPMGYTNEVGALVRLYHKWAGPQQKLVILAKQRTTALVTLDVQDALRANNLESDRLSPRLMDRFAQTLQSLPPGSLAILGDVTKMRDYEVELVDALKSRFSLCRIDSDQDVTVERLIDHGQTCAPS